MNAITLPATRLKALSPKIAITRYLVPGSSTYTAGDLWGALKRKVRGIVHTSGLSAETFLGHRLYNAPLRPFKMASFAATSLSEQSEQLRMMLQDENFTESSPVEILHFACEWLEEWGRGIHVFPSTLTFLDPKEKPRPVFFVLVGGIQRYLHLIESSEYPWPEAVLYGKCR